jgi:hypothetical protein
MMLPTRSMTYPQRCFGQTVLSHIHRLTLCRSPTENNVLREISPHTSINSVARICGDYIRRGIGLTAGFIGSQSITHLQQSLLQLQLTLTTESQLMLSLFRAQDLLQTQLALTGHQLTLLDSSPQLTVKFLPLLRWLATVVNKRFHC